MASIKFERKEIEKHIKLTPQNLEKIMLMGIPVEKVTEEEIEIEILANRPDLISIHGFIRAISSYIGKEKGLKKYKVNKPEKNYQVKIDSSVSNIRPYTVCAIVKNLNFNDSNIKAMIDIQEKLHVTFGRNRKKIAIGIYPLEKIKLPITYMAEKPEEIKFVPLEMNREMNGLQILQSHPTGKEYAHLLEGFEKFPIFIDSNKKILSMPPIINSNETGKVGSSTKDVFIECSGSDFNALNKTLNIIVTSLADMGGKIYSMDLIYDKKLGKINTPNLEPEKIKISLDKTNKILGLNLKEKEIENLVKDMGYDYINGKVIVPPWRTDIIHEVDVIEDIGIAYGYDKLAPEIPKVATIGDQNKLSKIKSKLSEIMIGLGFIEISTYYLVKAEEINNYKGAQKIEIENSKTDYKFIRPNLTISLVRILSENKDSEYPQKLFEIGPVFEKDENSETGIKERNNLVISITPGNFTEIKRILDYLSKMINLEFKIEQKDIKNMIEGRTAIIKIDGKEVGNMGEMHPEYLRDSGIKNPVSILEINIDKIFN